MLPSTCVVVPTYWTHSSGTYEAGDAVYDHPTPLDGQGTLDALLKSLADLSADFYVLILVAVTSDEVRASAEQRVREMAARYHRLLTLVFGGREYRLLQGWFDGKNLPSAARFLGLRHYPLIRNLQLAVPL